MTADPKTPDEKKPHGNFGNKNATKHGLRDSGLPEGCSYILGQVSAFRRYIRKELGEMSLWQEATLQSAIRHETHALLAARWLRLEAAKLSISERVALLKAVSDSSDKRDKALKAIGLDRDATSNIIAALYQPTENENGSA